MSHYWIFFGWNILILFKIFKSLKPTKTFFSHVRMYLSRLYSMCASGDLGPDVNVQLCNHVCGVRASTVHVRLCQWREWCSVGPCRCHQPCRSKIANGSYFCRKPAWVFPHGQRLRTRSRYAYTFLLQGVNDPCNRKPCMHCHVASCSVMFPPA